MAGGGPERDQDHLTHLDASGSASMVDVGDKAVTRRSATVTGEVKMHADTLALILSGNAKKGDVIATARIAGIMAAKRTHELIPLCHPLLLSKISVDIEPDHALPGLKVSATAIVTGQTGVEMEALTGVSTAALCFYDMCKGLDKGMGIRGIRLLRKTGGKSGEWTAEGGYVS